MSYINACVAREISIKSQLTNKQIKLKESMNYIMNKIRIRAQEGDTRILLNHWTDYTIPFYDDDMLQLIFYELRVLGYKVSFGATEEYDITFFSISWEELQ